MSVPPGKRDSWDPKEDGHPGALPSSFYYYSPNPAAPGSERSWQEGYNQMARRVTGGPSSWGSPAYGQQYQTSSTPQYSVFESSSHSAVTNTSDPWNWGWDEPRNEPPSNSSGNNNNNNNNNVQYDPTWDWSVEGPNNGYQHQVAPNSGVSYGSSESQRHVWQPAPPSPPRYVEEDGSVPVGYNQQAVPPNHPQQQVTNSQPVLEDTFNVDTVTNQQVRFQTVNVSGQSFCSFNAEENNGMHVLNNNNNNNEGNVVPQNGNSMSNQERAYTSGYYQGYSVSADVGQVSGEPQWTREEKLDVKPLEPPPPSEKNGVASPYGANAPSTELVSPVDVKMEAGSPEQKASAEEHPPSVPPLDADSYIPATLETTKSAYAYGKETLPSQWSTESLPSQGSEELLHTIEGQGMIKGERESTPQVVPEGAYQDRYTTPSGQYNYKVDVTSNRASPENQHVNVPLDGQEWESHGKERKPIRDVRSKSVSPRVEETSANRVDGTRCEFPAAGVAPHNPAEKLVKELRALSLNSPCGSAASSDVENAEIVPPENHRVPGIYPRAGGHGNADGTVPPAQPPPTDTPPLAPPKGLVNIAGNSSNPYSSRNAALNHKYSSKHRLLSQPANPADSSGMERMNYTKNLMQADMPPPMFNNSVGNFGSRPKVPTLSSTEDAVNLETVPDNKERPDVLDLQQPLPMERKSASPMNGTRSLASSVSQESLRGSVTQWGQQPLYSISPENQEVAPRCGPERNQYLETGQLPEDDLEVRRQVAEVDSTQYHPPRSNEPFLLPSGLHRMVPGQLTEQENVSSGSQSEANCETENQFHEDVATPPPGLHRMVPGQLTENESPAPLDNGTSISAHPNLDADDVLLHRMVPGRLTADEVTLGSVQDNSHSSLPPAGSSADEIPPPGLRRMVPGESSSPESQGNGGVLLTQGMGVPSASFQPLDTVPMEPRVVTGVAQDEMDIGANQSASLQLSPSSPMQLSNVRVTSQPASPIPEQLLTANTLPQPPSERSETIGSDSVETYLPPPSDNPPRELSSGRRDATSKERERRHREEQDGEERIRRRQANGRDYYSQRERDDSPAGGRYREDRERRAYDREREDSPTGGRYRYDSRHEYSRRPREEGHHSRRRRGYNRSDDDADNEDYYSDRERERERDRDRERDRRENPSYREDYGHYRNRSDRDRALPDVHEKSSRDRVDHRSTGRVREREGDRDRDRYHDRRRYEYERDYRWTEDHYSRAYNDDPYYRQSQRSRPTSRSGSRPEYEDDRRREYAAYRGKHPYGQNVQDSYYQYQPYPYQYLYQYPYHMYPWHQQYGVYPEDRGSVHSGRSSANEELHRERYQRAGHYHPYDYYRSPLTDDYDHGRAPDVNSSALEEEVSSPPQRLTPAKFPTAHIKAILTPQGQMLRVLSHYPLDGQPAIVEVHDMQNILATNSTYRELQDFPGPLVRNVTHKKSLMAFCARKIEKAERDPNLFDRESVILFWRLLMLLLRQNGTIIGTDIAELLLSNSSGQEVTSIIPGCMSRHHAQSPSTSQTSMSDLVPDEHPPHGHPPGKTEEEVTNVYRDFLLYGNTKEALEWAMKHGLWGHALFLASKMDQRTYANVMMRFANGLNLNDPLQTLYQLMSRHLPAAVTCCADERWGDWKPHLAMIVSNSSQWFDLHRQAITTLGDTLAGRGCLYAAHFCYVMAQLDFGTYAQKSSKMVLLGSSHSRPFTEFATNEAIQMTELYLYTIQLANPTYECPHFQAYKLLYARRLAEHGMAMEALQYAEVIAKAVAQQPTAYDLGFLQQVYELGNQLKLYDPVCSGRVGAADLEDASWLRDLAAIIEAYQAGSLQPDGPSYGSTSNLSNSEGEFLQPQYAGLDPVQHMQESQRYDHAWQQQQQQQQLYQDLDLKQSWQQQQKQQQQQTAIADSRVEGYQTVLEAVSDGMAAVRMEQPQNNYLPAVDDMGEIPVPDMIHPAHLQPQPQRDPEGYGSSGDVPVRTEPSHSLNAAAFDYWSVSASQEKEGGHPLDEGSGGALPEGTAPPPPPPPSPPLVTTPTTTTTITTPSSSGGGGGGKRPARKEGAAQSSWFGRMWNRLPFQPRNQMILPDDKNPSIVWDEKKNRWTNLDADADDSVGSVAPPPKASDLQGAAPTPGTASSGGPPPQNMYKMTRGRGPRANYVDVLGGKSASNPVVPASALFQPQPAAPGNFLVPAPVEAKEWDPVDFLSSSSTAAATVTQPSMGPEQVMSGESSQLSRSSSTSSLSREVQDYMSGSASHPARHLQGVSGPMLYNPGSFSQPSGAVTRKRYPN